MFFASKNISDNSITFFNQSEYDQKVGESTFFCSEEGYFVRTHKSGDMV